MTVVPADGHGLAGFEGKLPCRGDFVGRGLPRGFLTPWTAWVEAALAASRASLGETWVEAWLEAPIWCFTLPGGLAGPDAVAGLLMPSVDKADRHYPLTLACVFPAVSAAPDQTAVAPWLAEAEALAREALAYDLEPDALAQRLTALEIPGHVPAADAAIAIWWTEGGPRVPAASLSLPSLPEAEQFAGMLDGGGAV